MSTTKRDDWSRDGQVYYCDGKAYGLEDNLGTIWLGDKDKVEAILMGEKSIPEDMHPRCRAVLEKILGNRKEQGIGADIRANGMERAGTHGTFGREPKTTKLFTARKRLPVRPPRKGKSLSG